MQEKMLPYLWWENTFLGETTFLITGGAGFIGSRLVKALNKRGFRKIFIVDHLTQEKVKNLNQLDFLDFIEKSSFFSFLEKLKIRIDFCFHQGACTKTTEEDGEYLWENNYLFSIALLHYCQKYRIPMVYASSASVYGRGEKGFREDPSYEKPLNLYALSKWMVDQYVRRKKFPWVVGLRYFNVYGEGESHKKEMASVLWHFYQQYKKEKKIRLFEGSENFQRDFIYVEDVVKVNLFFMDKLLKEKREELSFFKIQAPFWGIFNVGTGSPRSFYDLAKIFQKHFPDAEIQWIPFPEKLKGKYQEYTCADLTLLRQAGYQEEFLSLEEGVEKYISYLKHAGE